MFYFHFGVSLEIFRSEGSYLFGHPRVHARVHEILIVSYTKTCVHSFIRVDHCEVSGYHFLIKF